MDKKEALKQIKEGVTKNKGNNKCLNGMKRFS